MTMGIDDNERLGEEPTPAEIGAACRHVLDGESCDEIAGQEDSETALGLAFTALEEAGKDPEVFLRSKGILE